ncbi:MAG: SusE domain-containing protein [Muribaculaceae bacterium]|nr:SusE domain-containing protein [Muribaculaceae bacterium]
MKFNNIKTKMSVAVVSAAVAAMGLGSCTDFEWHDEHETTLTAFDIVSEDVPAVVIEADKSNIDDEYILSWSASTAGDYTQVFYKVLFSADGNFASPAYELEPEQMGIASTLTLTNRQINIAAERAGIKQGASGQLKWTVRATNGVATRMSNSVRTIDITRPYGYAYNPAGVTLKGDGISPVGTIRNADGEFEIFAMLGDGEYRLTENESLTGRFFGIAGGELVEDGTFRAVRPGAIHHIRFNFNDATASIASVDEVGLWYSAANDVVAVMTQAADGSAVWSADYEFNAVKNDYRYKFRLTETDAEGNKATGFYGYSSSVAGFQNGSSPATYFYLYPEPGESQSSYCFRFNNTGLHGGKTLRITVDLTGASGNYTHKVEVL